MSSRNRSILLYSMLFGLLGLTLLPGFVRAAGDDLLVLPNRNAVVKVAFDVQYLRPCAMLSYENNLADPAHPFLFTWQAASRQWVKTDIETYATGDALAKTPRRVFVIGTDAALVNLLTASSNWCGDVTTIPSLYSYDIINALDKKLAFNTGEWKWLAPRYKLQLDDSNTDRRQYGRYGPPGAAVQPEVRKENPLLKWFHDRKKDKGTESGAELETIEPVTGLDAEVDETVKQAVEPAQAPVEEKGGPQPVMDAPAEPAMKTVEAPAAVEQPAPAAVQAEMPAEDK